MNTASELIDALGGNAIVAQIAGVKSSAVSNWRATGVFPPRHAIVLKRAANGKGVDAPDDLFCEKTRRERRAEAAAEAA